MTDATGDATDLPIEAAAARLGISVDALRLRIRRGKSIHGYKRAGRWYVRLPDDATDATDATGRDRDANDQPRPDQSAPVHEGEAALVEQLRSEVGYLRAALQRSQEAEGEQRRIIAGLMQRLPELAAPASTRGDAPTAAPAPSVMAEVPAVPGPARRPWWRRWGR